MRMKRILLVTLVLVTVPVLFLMAMLTTSQNKTPGSERAGVSKQTSSDNFTMLDPQGDLDMARRIVSYGYTFRSVASAPQVILSRRVRGGQLPCLGIGGGTFLEARPTDMFGVVVLGGELRQAGFLGASNMPMPYIAYVYDIKDEGVTSQGGPQWASLRAAFGKPDWPQSSPMYLSPDGQPSVEQFNMDWRGLNGQTVRGQDVDVSRKIGEWTVTVGRVYTETGRVMVVYTVTGPQQRFSIDQPILSVGGSSVLDKDNEWRDETLGPSANRASFWGLPETGQTQEVTAHFIIPALHVHPERYPCEDPSKKPEEYPTPTRIPNEIVPGSYGATPMPDMQTVGPFNFELNLHIEPKPTQPPLPSPIPTPEGAVRPFPPAQPTGLPH